MLIATKRRLIVRAFGRRRGVETKIAGRTKPLNVEEIT